MGQQRLSATEARVGGLVANGYSNSVQVEDSTQEELR
jgi:hypothetical protein